MSKQQPKSPAANHSQIELEKKLDAVADIIVLDASREETTAMVEALEAKLASLLAGSPTLAEVHAFQEELSRVRRLTDSRQRRTLSAVAEFSTKH